MKNNNYYKVTRLGVDLWVIEDVKSSENSMSYVLRGKNKTLVFDTGLGLSPVLPLIKKITNLTLMVYLSHWHFDHSGGAYEFSHLTGWKSRQFEATSKYGVSNKVIQTQVGQDFWDGLGIRTLRTKSFPQIHFIDQEQVIDIGGYALRLLHTPGHTMDSICLYEPSKQWLFTGDTAYPGPIYLQFEDSSKKSFGAAIERLLSLPVNEIFPGHNSVRVPQNLLSEINKMTIDTTYRSVLYPELAIRCK